jgi:hypothetical protein
MTDPDLMKHNDPLNKQVRHWVQPGLTIAEGASDLHTTRAPHTSFVGSAPIPGTGAHRYVFILAKESEKGAERVGVGERAGQADFKDRLRFSAADFIKEHGLEVVGVAFMEVEPTASAGVDDAKMIAEVMKHVVTG